MEKEGIDVTGIPGPNPMLGCGIILFVVFDFCIYKLPSDLHLKPI